MSRIDMLYRRADISTRLLVAHYSNFKVNRKVAAHIALIFYVYHAGTSNRGDQVPP